MATAYAIASSSYPHIASFHSNSHLSLPTRTRSTRTHPSLISTSPIIIPSKKIIFFHHPLNLISQRTSRLAPIPAAAAAAEDVLPSEAAAVDATQQLVSNTDDGGVSTVVSALLFAAFIGLSILTIGVIYLGVTDFLQKREKEKFEKEEAANKSGNKKKKKKKVVRTRAVPRGFGQKIDEDEDDD